MKRLRHQDWKNLFSALSVLHSDIAPETIRERCVAAANMLVASHIRAFDFFTAQGVHTGENWYDPPGMISQADFEIFAHVAHEHPFSPDVFGKKRFDAMQTGDFLTNQQFHRTAIYNEFFKLYDVDHQLLVAFSDAPGSIITCNYSRTKSEFSEEERLIVNLLSEHLRIAIQNAHKIEQFYKAELRLNAALGSKSTGVIVLNSNKQIIYESSFARRMLEKYFADEKSEFGGLPDSLGRWIKNESGIFGDKKISPPNPFKIDRENEKLEVCLMDNAAAEETTLLIEETINSLPQMPEQFNLTNRESEILFWLSCGKTNKEIAALLGISSRTVNKHTENIYKKLGVETRTAAASVAFDKLK